MISTLWISIAIAFFFIVIAATAKQNGARRTGKDSPIHAKSPLTENEKPMYFRLAQTFPEHIVLAQVSFSALLETTSQTSRNRYQQKDADFVLCTKAFEVIAIIELDDASHNGRELRDANRDKLLTSAGYRVLRYKRVPDSDTLSNSPKPSKEPVLRMAREVSEN